MLRRIRAILFTGLFWGLLWLPVGVVIGLVQLQNPWVVTQEDLAKQTHRICASSSFKVK